MRNKKNATVNIFPPSWVSCKIGAHTQPDYFLASETTNDVSVCVCVWERERERERRNGTFFLWVSLDIYFLRCFSDPPPPPPKKISENLNSEFFPNRGNTEIFNLSIPIWCIHFFPLLPFSEPQPPSPYQFYAANHNKKSNNSICFVTFQLCPNISN